MQYEGKLYGGTTGKLRRYFDTGKTSDDWDRMESEIRRLNVELDNSVLNHGRTSASLEEMTRRAERLEKQLYDLTHLTVTHPKTFAP